MIEFDFICHIGDNTLNVKCVANPLIEGNYGPCVLPEDAYPDEGGDVEITAVELEDLAGSRAELIPDGLLLKSYLSKEYQIKQIMGVIDTMASERDPDTYRIAERIFGLGYTRTQTFGSILESEAIAAFERESE